MSAATYSYAEALYRDRLFGLVKPETEWLDLGCGYQLLPGWLKNSQNDQREIAFRCKRLVGIDAVAEDIARHPYLHERMVADIQCLPFANDSFTLLTARSVIEHIESPLEMLQEVRRVLRSGGQFLFVTPNVLYYQCLIASITPDRLKKRVVRYLEGRDERDVFKAHYRCNTIAAVTRLASRARVEIESIETIECPPEFSRLGRPFVSLEKGLTAVLRTKWLASFRAAIVCILRKP